MKHLELSQSSGLCYYYGKCDFICRCINAGKSKQNEDQAAVGQIKIHMQTFDDGVDGEAVNAHFLLHFTHYVVHISCFFSQYITRIY